MQRAIRTLSVCTGIGAFEKATEGLPFESVAFAEIAPFPSAVLAYRFPGVPNLGDFTKIGDEYVGRVDLAVGGTPCQSNSIAGCRAGLDDPRGNLTLEFFRLAKRLGTRWILWENVPGVLSVNGGRDFGIILGALGQLGYGFAYRVLDAQFFGVPQQRRRVLVVGCAGGDWRRAAAALLEQKSMSWPYPQGRRTGEEITGTVTTRTGNANDNVVAECGQCLVRDGRPCWVTPRECERLQGFPDDWTLVPYRGKPAKDGPRYHGIGNSMAVPVMRWIAERIAVIDGHHSTDSQRSAP